MMMISCKVKQLYIIPVIDYDSKNCLKSEQVFNHEELQ